MAKAPTEEKNNFGQVTVQSMLSSPADSPIHGYNEDGEPTSAITLQRNNPPERKPLSSYPPRIRRRTWSGQLPSCLSAVPEDHIVQDFEDSVSVFDRGSLTSLDWDYTSNTKLSESKFSSSTQFSVPLGSDCASLSSPPEEFHDAEDDIFLVPSPTRFQFPFEDQDTDIMPPNPILKHRQTLLEVKMVYEDDIKDLEIEEVTEEFLKDKLKEAETLKTKSQSAMLALLELDKEAFVAELQEDAAAVKKEIIAFIRAGQKLLRDQEIKEQHQPARNVQVDPAREASIRIKTKRVQNYEEKTIGDLNSLVDELKVLNITDPRTDNEYRTLEERFLTLSKRADLINEDARKLCDDAVAAGLEQEAANLETAIREVKDTQIEVESRVHEHKASFGIISSSISEPSADLKPPQFSGDPTEKMDYFTFFKEFNEYLSCKPLSRADQLRLLKQNCLQGAAKIGCSYITDIESAWEYLKDTYGNTTILFAAKLEELRKLGSCQGSNIKKREWALSVRSKLMFLNNLSVEHGLEDELCFSSVVSEIQHNLPPAQLAAFKKICKKKDPTGNISRRMLFVELVKYVDTIVADFTFEINYEFVSVSGPKAESTAAKQQSYKPLPQKPGTGKKTYNVSKTSGAAQPNPGPSSKKPVYGTYTQPQERKCKLCPGKHVFLQYCEQFQKSDIRDRYRVVGRANVCFRCLRLDSEVDFVDRQSWWEKHKSNCRTDWNCKQGKCATREIMKQYHFTLCVWHMTQNVDLEKEYMKSLDQNLIRPGTKFFYSAPQVFNLDVVSPPTEKKYPGFQILPDIDEPSIFLLQILRVDQDKDLLLFYDSGCMGASLSDRAVSILETETVRPGPTFMSVAGAETIRLETGDERFWLTMEDKKTKATITGLHMPNITTPFPMWDLQEAWDDVQVNYRHEYPNGEPLPEVDKTIGGCAVDLMLGIRYNVYFPTLLFSLPCGLGIYKSKFSAARNHLGILGGPHRAWRNAHNSAHVMGPRVYFTAEMRAYYITGLTLKHTLQDTVQTEPELFFSEPTEEEFSDDECNQQHCNKHSVEGGWMVPLSWDISSTRYSIRLDENRFTEIEDIGTSTQYRCIRCRNCSDCRKGELLERTSLQEEAEQALIESCVTLDPENKRLESRLPFIKDPFQQLKPNRHIAEKVLQSQLRLVTKNPEMKMDVIKSHEKLRSKGHVLPVDELSETEVTAMNSVPGEGHVIPWRTVYKESSLSTPCRLVFDASSRTPGGESLNGTLAKGENKLGQIVHILIRFRRKSSAMTADVSMAYNGIKLRHDNYKFQQYLWKEDLDPENPTRTMVVRTLIYGVRPAGNLTMAGFDCLSEYCRTQFPEHSRGAAVLSDDTYMDDVMHSEDTEEECKQVANSLDFTLSLGTMSVKAYTFSGTEPSDLVSSDGVHVGLLGLRWDPKDDVISLDVKALYLEKPKRGKLPELVRGEIGPALKERFTRRTLVGKVASVYDPLGLVTPITARLKLDLSRICKMKYDWDDTIPDEYLEQWIRNLEDIQELKEVKFRRTLIPSNAKSTDIELIVSVDASENIAVACVHSRVGLKDGGFHVQLVCAKSKLVTMSTIPRGELRAAVIGSILAHTVKLNLQEQFQGAIYVTDSTVVLYWINQDQRPLQVGVRNSVIEIRRFSQPCQWFHIDTGSNLADLGTRNAEIEEIESGTEWQDGKEWMRREREDMPLKTLVDVTLTSEERRIASQEMRAPDVGGIVLSNLLTKVSDRYSFSKYLVDPCRLSWPRSVRVVAYVARFIMIKVPAWRKAWLPKPEPGTEQTEPGTEQTELAPHFPKDQFTGPELRRAERYFFLKTTKEVRQFSKELDWKNCSVLADGILLYSGRILDGQEITAVEKTMWDLEPLSFVKPIVDRFSPVAYSIMEYTHSRILKHRNSVSTLRESRNLAYILRGRDLSIEIRESCVSCRRFKAKLLEVEMGKIHDNRLTIAPPFYQVQVDLLGPYTARCEHNHRSTVDVYGVVFKDPCTAAIAVYVMAKYDTPSFLQAYTRFSSRYGHPSKLFIDQGSQLVKACKKMELNITDVTTTLNSKYQVGVEYETCPVGGHNAHGIVERSIKEVKKLLNLVYGGLKLDILSYETAFAFISNELNNLPICLGSRTSSLEHTDLISPSRLLLGRNNNRALSGFARMSGPSRLLEQLESVERSWWEVWKEEKIVDYIPQPRKWRGNNGDVKVGDIVIFLKAESEQTFGNPVWKIGRICDLELSKDGLVRTVIIEYKNASEAVFRTTRRSARKIAVLHREGDLELVDLLNEASKLANVNYSLNMMKQDK